MKSRQRKPWKLIGKTSTPDGSGMHLTVRNNEYVIHVNGDTLMSSRMHGSEEALATLACQHLQTSMRPQVLVGGLGMGFTLRATLDLLPPDANVTVCELIPSVIEWNRGPLAPLANYPLNDPRVRLRAEDVGFTVRAHTSKYDAILLDVDNGPAAFTELTNDGLYTNSGIEAAYAALKDGGTFAVWSAWDDRKFEQRLRFHGFTPKVDRVRARHKKGGRWHTIFLGLKPFWGTSIPGRQAKRRK